MLIIHQTSNEYRAYPQIAGWYSLEAFLRFSDNTGIVDGNVDAAVMARLVMNDGTELAVENNWVRRDYRRCAECHLVYDIKSEHIIGSTGGCYFQIGWRNVTIDSSYRNMRLILKYHGWGYPA